MPLNLTARQVEIADPLREYIESKKDRYHKYFKDERISTIEVTVEKERHLHKVDILVRAGKNEFLASEKNEDMRVAFDQANDKILKQMEKRKKRTIDRKKSPQAKASKVAEEQVVESQAIFAGPGGLPAWVTPEEIEVRECGIEEALDRLNALDHRNFFVFRNSHNDQIQVIFKRKDGKIGLVMT